jgi:CheY-like chemotaxis protein
VAVESATQEQEATNSSGEGLILVVDDEPMVRKLAETVLQRCGYRVATAKNGRQAIEIFKERAQEIDMVLLDMTMPHMSGVETFDAMRAIRSNVVALLSSGYSEAEATGHFRGKGLSGFMQKPYLPQTLASKIKEVLEK